MNKKILRFLLPALVCSLFGAPFSVAQDTDEPTTYHVFNYMKVKPGMHEEYIKLEAAWKKIHIASKAQNIQDGWALIGLITPSGTSTEYNYVTRNTFMGEEKLGAFLEQTSMLEDWQSLLNEEEIAIVQETVSIRDLVKTEVYAVTANLWADDMSNSKIRVFNYFDHPVGKYYADHHAMAQKIWVPVHKERIKQGIMKGWAMGVLVAPRGTDMPYQNITVDFYESIEDMLNTPYPELMATVHPDLELASIFAESEANADLVKSEIRILIDQVD